MKKRSWPLLALIAFLLVVSACQPGKQELELLSYIDSLEQVYAPDSRLALWDVSIRVNGREISIDGEVDAEEAYILIEKKLIADFPDASSELMLLPEGAPGLAVHALVNNSVIHLRREPSSKSEMVTQTLLGHPVRILKEGHGKYLVQIPDGYIGWVNKPEVHVLEGAGLSAYQSADKVVFVKQYGFVHESMEAGSRVVGDLVAGNILVALESAGPYVKVRYPDGREGYVWMEEVKAAEMVFEYQPTGEDLVKTALNYIGIPYLWGGTSAKNIDCSGLMSNIYYLNGIQLPRDADLQSRCGLEISTEYVYQDLLPGDLLFWGRKATDDKPERVTHVGMYIGGGEFIHSAGHKERVSINSMDPGAENFIESYPEIFVRSVRILGEEGGWTPVTENVLFKEVL